MAHPILFIKIKLSLLTYAFTVKFNTCKNNINLSGIKSNSYDILGILNLWDRSRFVILHKFKNIFKVNNLVRELVIHI